MLLGVCLDRWHFAGRVFRSLAFFWVVFGSLAFCWACVWIVGILLGVCSLAFCLTYVWVVGILLGVCLGRWHFAGRMFGSLAFC